MAKFEGRVREEVGYRDFPAYSNWTNAQGVPKPLDFGTMRIFAILFANFREQSQY